MQLLHTWKDLRFVHTATPGQTIHLILEATDNGELPLTRDQRVIVTVAK